jgi:BolA family transcriptional regulator, general stress-responsive regulator
VSPLVLLVTQRLSPLSPLVLEISDDSAQHIGHAGNTGGGHLSAKIVSKMFSGMSAMARHRAVYALVVDLMPQQIHALSLTLRAPEEL